MEYLRNADDVAFAVAAVLRGGNAGMFEVQANGITAQWGADGVVTFTGILIRELNATALLTETVEPQVVTTTREERPEIITTNEQTQDASTEVTLEQRAASVSEVRQDQSDEEQTNGPTETTSQTTLGSDETTQDTDYQQIGI
jgi:hypothetical protein